MLESKLYRLVKGVSQVYQHGSNSIGTWSQHGVVDGIRQGTVADQLGLALVLALGLGDALGVLGVKLPEKPKRFGDL